MHKLKLAALAAMTLAVTGATSFAQQPARPAGATVPDGKVAVINTQAFPAQIGELRQKYEQVDNQFKDRYEKLQALETQLRQMESEIRTKGPGWTPDKLAQAQNDYEDLKKRGTRDYEDLKAEHERVGETATKPVRDKLYQFLEKYAAQKGIVLVFNLAGAAQTGSLAYWHPSADVTDDFIAEYNKANPVAGATAAQPTAPLKPVTRPPTKP